MFSSNNLKFLNYTFFSFKGALPHAPPGFMRVLSWNWGGVQRYFNGEMHINIVESPQTGRY